MKYLTGDDAPRLSLAALAGWAAVEPGAGCAPPPAGGRIALRAAGVTWRGAFVLGIGARGALIGALRGRVVGVREAGGLGAEVLCDGGGGALLLKEE